MHRYWTKSLKKSQKKYMSISWWPIRRTVLPRITISHWNHPAVCPDADSRGRRAFVLQQKTRNNQSINQSIDRHAYKWWCCVWFVSLELLTWVTFMIQLNVSFVSPFPLGGFEHFTKNATGFSTSRHEIIRTKLGVLGHELRRKERRQAMPKKARTMSGTKLEIFSMKKVQWRKFSEESSVKEIQWRKFSKESSVKKVQRRKVQWRKFSGGSSVKKVQWRKFSGGSSVEEVQWGKFSGESSIEEVQWRKFSGGSSVEEVQWRKFNGGSSVEEVQWRKFSEESSMEEVQWRKFNRGSSVEEVQWRKFSGENSVEVRNTSTIFLADTICASTLALLSRRSSNFCWKCSQEFS